MERTNQRREVIRDRYGRGDSWCSLSPTGFGASKMTPINYTAEEAARSWQDAIDYFERSVILEGFLAHRPMLEFAQRIVTTGYARGPRADLHWSSLFQAEIALRGANGKHDGHLGRREWWVIRISNQARSKWPNLAQATMRANRSRPSICERALASEARPGTERVRSRWWGESVHFNFVLQSDIRRDVSECPIGRERKWVSIDSAATGCWPVLSPP